MQQSQTQPYLKTMKQINVVIKFTLSMETLIKMMNNLTNDIELLTTLNQVVRVNIMLFINQNKVGYSLVKVLQVTGQVVAQNVFLVN